MQTKDENIRLAKQLQSLDIWMKVGLRSFIRDGKTIIDELKNINPNFKIFLDLKLYDIPNTMADAAEAITELGVDMFNVHASSGVRAMKMVMDRIKAFKNPPLVLSVTALTSFSNDEFLHVYNEDIKTKAVKLACDTHQAGLHGVVCSVHESLDIKKHTSKDFITLTPGIRPFNEDSNDQKRVATIEDAKEQNCDFIVVGRPIYHSSNPFDVASKIIEKL
jgi:orotidine-5'-phosphate decarboxylase